MNIIEGFNEIKNQSFDIVDEYVILFNLAYHYKTILLFDDALKIFIVEEDIDVLSVSNNSYYSYIKIIFEDSEGIDKFCCGLKKYNLRYDEYKITEMKDNMFQQSYFNSGSMFVPTLSAIRRYKLRKLLYDN